MYEGFTFLHKHRTNIVPIRRLSHNFSLPVPGVRMGPKDSCHFCTLPEKAPESSCIPVRDFPSEPCRWASGILEH